MYVQSNITKSNKTSLTLRNRPHNWFIYWAVRSIIILVEKAKYKTIYLDTVHYWRHAVTKWARQLQKIDGLQETETNNPLMFPSPQSQSSDQILHIYACFIILLGTSKMSPHKRGQERQLKSTFLPVFLLQKSFLILILPLLTKSHFYFV